MLPPPRLDDSCDGLDDEPVAARECIPTKIDKRGLRVGRCSQGELSTVGDVGMCYISGYFHGSSSWARGILFVTPPGWTPRRHFAVWAGSAHHHQAQQWLGSSLG
jgi:hypothetical protein